MGSVSGAISRDCETCQSSGLPIAEAGSDDSDGLRG